MSNRWKAGFVQLYFDPLTEGPTIPELYLWGKGISGNLANDLGGLTAYRSSPIQVSTATKWSSVAAGQAFVVATKTDGTLWAWGRNDQGQLGQSDRVGRSSPVQIGALTNWSKVACGGQFFISIKTDGTLWGCGTNSGGVLGINGPFTYRRSSPVQIGADADWSLVACGDYHVATIKTNGTMWTWGSNGRGQLGQSTSYNAYRSSPVQVGALSTWIKVSAGYRQTYGATSDGIQYVWGNNDSGQLGLGNVNISAGRSSPIQLGSANEWQEIIGAVNTTVALKTDGTLWTMGSNANGALMLNISTGSYRSSPTQVGAETNWSAVGTSLYTSAALKTDGTMWGSGFNSGGQLGDNTRVSKSSPVQVVSSSPWSSIVSANAGEFIGAIADT